MTENTDFKRLYFRLLRRQRDMKRESAIEEVNKLGAGMVKVLCSMADSAKSNPLMGIFLSFVMSDILYRLKIIDLETVVLLDSFIGATNAASIAGTVISDIGDLIPFAQGSGKAESLIQPTANVVVSGNDNMEDLQALLRANKRL